MRDYRHRCRRQFGADAAGGIVPAVWRSLTSQACDFGAPTEVLARLAMGSRASQAPSRTVPAHALLVLNLLETKGAH